MAGVLVMSTVRGMLAMPRLLAVRRASAVPSMVFSHNMAAMVAVLIRSGVIGCAGTVVAVVATILLGRRVTLMLGGLVAGRRAEFWRGRGDLFMVATALACRLDEAVVGGGDGRRRTIAMVAVVPGGVG
jgi:hypothetical protein